MLRTLLRLGVLYARLPRHLALALLCTVLSTILGLAVPWILKETLDYGVQQHQHGFFVLASSLLVLVTLLRGVVLYGQNYLAAYLAQRLAYQLRQGFYAHVQRLSFSYHDRAQTGDLMARATADVEAVRLFFHFGLPSMVSLACTGVGSVLAIAWLDWRLAVWTLLSLPLFLGVAVWIGHCLRPLQQRVQEATGSLTVVLQESLTGIRVVKALAREASQTQQFTAHAETLYRAYLQAARTQAQHFPILTLLLACAVALTLYTGGQQVMTGRLSLGALVAATGYLAQLALPLRRLSWLTGMASHCQAGAQRLFAVLDAVPEIHDRPQAIALPALQGRVAFERVSFHYTGQAAGLREVTFTASPGQMIALFGSVGSGKTTIAQLLPRFYDVSAGRILLDGIDIRAVQLASLRRQIGMVMQESVLFSTTIRDNIAYGRDDLTLDEIMAAARAAHAHDFIMAFPQGYDTWVGERGVTLSGGQRQRLAIARTLVRNPRILILDDATASVDTETEWLIQQALATLMVGRTTLVIAQRLRTLQRADCILVLDDGRIIQRGTHSALLHQPGLYRRIYNLQFANREVEEHRPTAAADAGSAGHA